MNTTACNPANTADSTDSTASTHFAHRESLGYVVDLYWDPADDSHEFRVEVIERRSGDGLVLYPTNGRDAMHAFHHPFVAAQNQPSWLFAALAPNPTTSPSPASAAA